MTTCADLLPELFKAGDEAARLLKSETLATACMQAVATAQAGIAQAKAARDAGHWIAGAGLLTVLAGAIGYVATQQASRTAFRAAIGQARVALRGTRETILSQRKEAEEARLFAFKRHVFEGVIEAVFQALMSLPQLANISATIESSIANLERAVPALSRLYLVSDTKTTESILLALNTLISARNVLILQRVNVQKMPTSEMSGMAFKLANLAIQQTATCVPSFVEMVVNIRRQLGITTDAAAYADVVSRMTEMTGVQSRAFLQEVLRTQ